jgi:DNA-binding transcriptional LysR family regulator
MTTILERTNGLMAFVQTVDAGSFSEAARAIGSTPSAVSKSVARLERRLGVRLLQRSTRTLGLTSEGAAYYERVAPLLRAIEAADDVVQQAGSASGLLRVTAPHDLGRGLIAKWVRDFVDQNPAVKVELSLNERYVNLVREGYDLAIRMRDLADSDLVIRKLADMRIVIAASPDYVARRGAPKAKEDLHDHACLRYLLNGRPFPFTFADGSSMTPNGPFDSDDSGAIRQAVLGGIGIGYMLRFTVAEELATGRLLQLLPNLELPSLPLFAVHAYGRQLPVRVRLFIDFLVKQMVKTEI